MKQSSSVGFPLALALASLMVSLLFVEFTGVGVEGVSLDASNIPAEGKHIIESNRGEPLSQDQLDKLSRIVRDNESHLAHHRVLANSIVAQPFRFFAVPTLLTVFLLVFRKRLSGHLLGLPLCVNAFAYLFAHLVV
jgi:hypothetical protein